MHACKYQIARLLKLGNVSHMCAAITGLAREDTNDEASKTYAIYLADTVIVTPGGAAAEVATGGTAKEWKEVAYYLKVSCEFDMRILSARFVLLQLLTTRLSYPATQDGEEEGSDGEEDAGDADDVEQVAGVRKSARTEQIDFKAREEERSVTWNA